ncbi:hypothetical protein KY366_02825 [Candidatus Woesearchaeota archaeon]|nr:hypothetical protein [Candidatus Woesearchaeota archaeon]
MKKRYLALTSFLVLVSLVPFALSYNWMKSSQGTDITNNPSPTPWVKYYPDNYRPLMGETYIKDKSTNHKIVLGSGFENPVDTYSSDATGSYVKWEYPFSANLPTGKYAFHTKAADLYSNEFEYDMDIIIETVPPTVKPYSNPTEGASGFIFEGNTQTDQIELGSDVTIKAKVEDKDNGVDIKDTVVTLVNVVVSGTAADGTPITPVTYEMEDGNNDGVYGLTIPSPTGGDYMASFTAYDSLSDTVSGTGNINDTVSVSFTVGDTIKPAKPVIWPLPQYTQKGDADNQLTVVGYIGEQGTVDAHVFQPGESILSFSTTAQDGAMPLENIALQEKYLAGGGYYEEDTEIYIPDYDAGKITSGDYLAFYNHQRTNFARYGVASKDNVPGDRTKVVLVQGLEKDVPVNPTSYISVADKPLPPGYFEIGLTLYHGQNKVQLLSYDAAGNFDDIEFSIISDSVKPKGRIISPYDEITNNDKTPVSLELDGTGSDIDPDSIVMDINGPCNMLDLAVGEDLAFEGEIATFEITGKNYCKGKDQYLNGDYTVTLSATDMAGNENTSIEFGFKVDTSASSGPELTIINGNSLELEGTLYTSETMPEIKASFPKDTQVNSYSLKDKTSGTEHQLEYTKLDDKHFTFEVLFPALAEGSYVFEINAKEDRPGAVSTSFSFDIIVDTTAPNLENIIVPSTVEYGSEDVVKLKATDPVGVDSVRIKIGDSYYSLDRYENGLFNISTEDFLPHEPPFTYAILFEAKDLLGNEQLTDHGEIEFTDSTPPEVTVLEPETGYTNKAPNTIKIGTDDPSYCRFSWRGDFLESFVYDFSSSDKLTHSYDIDISTHDDEWDQDPPNTFNYYVECSNIFDLSTGILKMQIIVDTDSLNIISADSAKLSYYSDNSENTITVKTNKPARCRYSDNTDEDYENMDNSMGEEFVTENSVTEEFDNGDHQLFIDCRDKAGNTADNPTSVSFTVDVDEDVSILSSGPGGVLNDNTPTLWAKLNKDAECTFEEMQPTSHTTIREGGRIYYLYYHDVASQLDEGLHEYKVRCFNVKAVYDDISFTLDTEPPEKPEITSPADDSLAGDSLTVTGTTDDDARKVFFYVDNAYLGYADVDGQGFAKTLDLSGFDDGDLVIMVNAEDEFRQNGRSGEDSVTVVKDTVSEQPRLDELPQYTNSGFAEVLGSAEPGSTVYFYRFYLPGQEGDSVATTTATSDVDGPFSSSLSLNEGSNYIYARATDTMGNPLSESSNEVFMIYDAQSPSFTGMSPADGDTGVYGEKLIISVLVSDNYEINEDSVSFLIDNNEAVYEKAHEQGGIRLTVEADLDDGQHTAYVSAEDASGILGYAEWSFDTFIPVSCLSWACDKEADRWCDNGAWNTADYCTYCGIEDSDCESEVTCAADECDTSANEWCDSGVWNTADYCIHCGMEDYQCGALPPNLIGFSINGDAAEQGDYADNLEIEAGFEYGREAVLEDIQLDDQTIANWQDIYETEDNIRFYYDLGSLQEGGPYKLTIRASNEGFAQSTDSLLFYVDTSAPTIDIDDSIDTLVSSPYVPIYGTYAEPNLRHIKLNNILLDKADIGIGSFSRNLNLPVDAVTDVQAVIEDKAGNTGQDSISIEVRTGELLLEIEELPAITKEDSFTLEGTTMPDIDVEIDVNGDEILTLNSDSNGDFSQQLDMDNGLHDGNNMIIVTAEDGAGRTASVKKYVHIDREGPAIISRNPDAGEQGDFSRITLTLEDISGIAEDSVVLKLDGETVQHNFNALIGSLSYGISSLEKGSHTLEISSEDNLGNSMSSSWDFTINRGAPLIVMVSPATDFVDELQPVFELEIDNYDSVEQPTLVDSDENAVDLILLSKDPFRYMSAALLDDGQTYKFWIKAAKEGNVAELNKYITVDTTLPEIRIDRKALPDATGKEIVDVEGTFAEDNLEIITVNGIEVSPLDMARGRFIVRDVPLGETTTEISAVIRDKAGNEGSDTTYVEVDRDAPPLTISSPAEGQVFGDSTLIVSGETEPDALLSINGYYYSKSAVLDDGSFTVKYTMAPGDNALLITALDKAGNVGSELLNAYYDVVSPEITAIKPDKNMNKAPVEIRANLKDRSQITRVAISISDDNGYYYNYILPHDELESSQESLLYLYSPPEDDTYTITITAEDEFGNRNSKSKEFLFDTDIPSEPAFNLNGMVISDDSPQLIFQFEEEVNEPSLSISASLESSPDHKQFVYSTSVLTDGIYPLEITASKTVGKGSEASYSFEFTVDTTPPVITIDDSVPDFVGLPPLVDISGDCSDANLEGIGLSVDDDSIYVNCEDGRYLAEGVSLGSDKGIDDGDKQIIVMALDKAGNTNSASKVIELDTGYPDIEITGITNNDDIKFVSEIDTYKTNEESLTILGTYQDSNFDTIVVEVNGIVLDYPSLTLDEALGTFELDLELDGDDGEEFENNIVLTARDSSGLEGMADITIIKDMKGPSIAEFEPATRVVDNQMPLITITTNEYASMCTLTYITDVNFLKTEPFNMVEDNTKFSVQIPVNLKDITEAQNLDITCLDAFSNVGKETIPLTVDLLDPSIDSFDLFYTMKIPWETTSDYKKYLIKGLNSLGGTAASIALNVKPSEDARCAYSGSEAGYFNNHEYASGLMLSDSTHTLDDGTEYTFNIICEDKAGRLSEVKVIDVLVDSDHPVTAPSIDLDSPPDLEGHVFITRSPTFEGSIISLTPGTDITRSQLIINGTTYDLALDEDGMFSQTINTLPADAVYPFVIQADVSEDVPSSVIEGWIKVDTTGPGGCGTVAGVTSCTGEPAQSTTPVTGIICGDDQCDYRENCVEDCILRVDQYSLLTMSSLTRKNLIDIYGYPETEQLPFILHSAYYYYPDDTYLLVGIHLFESSKESAGFLAETLEEEGATSYKIGTNTVYRTSDSIFWLSDNKIIIIWTYYGSSDYLDLASAYLARYPSTTV